MNAPVTDAHRQVANDLNDCVHHQDRFFDEDHAAQLIANAEAVAVATYHDHYEIICNELTPELWKQYNRPETTPAQWRVLALNATAEAKQQLAVLRATLEDISTTAHCLAKAGPLNTPDLATAYVHFMRIGTKASHALYQTRPNRTP